MNPRLHEMLDHYEIVRALNEYRFACDCCGQPRMANVYLERSWDNRCNYAGSGPEFTRIMTQAIMKQTKILFQLLGQSLIYVEGDESGAETYFSRRREAWAR